jgi:hypothetical protein
VHEHLITHENDSFCLLVQLTNCHHLFHYIKKEAKARKTALQHLASSSISINKRLHGFFHTKHGLPPEICECALKPSLQRSQHRGTASGLQVDSLLTVSDHRNHG